MLKMLMLMVVSIVMTMGGASTAFAAIPYDFPVETGSSVEFREGALKAEVEAAIERWTESIFSNGGVSSELEEEKLSNELAQIMARSTAPSEAARVILSVINEIYSGSSRIEYQGGLDLGEFVGKGLNDGADWLRMNGLISDVVLNEVTDLVEKSTVNGLARSYWISKVDIPEEDFSEDPSEDDELVTGSVTDSNPSAPQNQLPGGLTTERVGSPN